MLERWGKHVPFVLIMLTAWLTMLLQGQVCYCFETGTTVMGTGITRQVTPGVIESGIDSMTMMNHINTLAGEIGLRAAGSEEERQAGEYITRELESYGYVVNLSPEFPLHNGLTSRNVWADLQGENSRIMIIGAHYDSKPPSPGANDNGSGCAVLLEMARVLFGVKTPYTIRFVFFGAEEIVDGNSDHHHYGSRFLAEDEELREMLHSVTSVDMVAVGSSFWVDNMGRSDDSWRQYLYNKAEEMELPVQTGEQRAWSDHEAFEEKGVPVAWVHWRFDTQYHKLGDTPDRIDTDLLEKTAKFMVRSVLEVDGMIG